ncbi:6594_t:CDS:2, partial [Dentiscutata heterogama]
NDKLFFTTTNSFDIKNYFVTKNFDNKNFFYYDVKYIDIFDTTLNKWETKIDFAGTPSEYFGDYCLWISDNKTGKSYSLQWITDAMDIFDTINFKWSVNTIPILYWDYVDQSVYGPPRILLPSGKIIHIGGKTDSYKKLMERLLTYDTITDSWEIINTIGEIPDERTFHTAVLSK